jgi:hypothetical protein
MYMYMYVWDVYMYMHIKWLNDKYYLYLCFYANIKVCIYVKKSKYIFEIRFG